MGNRDHDNLISLLDQKNAEIEQLNVEILAYSARTSNLQTRLLQTFDVLDEIQRNHARELEELEGKYARLERRFHRHAVILNASEAERTELRESVLELVEKVEQSNDIRSWPVNRLQLTRFTEYPRQPKSTAQQPIEEKLAYAGAIIDQLRRERNNEREGHIQTCEALQSKIDLLVTQLARRDTELEYYVTHPTHTPTSLPGRDDDTASASSSGYRRMNLSKARRTSLPPQTGREGERETVVVGPAPAQGLTNEGIIKMLNATAARNRSLEVEIKTLFKQLEQARSRSSSSAPTPAPKAWPSPPPNSQPVSEPGNAPTATARYNIVIDGTRDNRNQDAFDESDGYGDGDRVGGAQRHPSHNQSSRDKGSSRTKSQARTVTPSNQNSYGVSRPNRSNPGVRNTRKGRAERGVHEDSEAFNRDQHQDMGSPIRGKQSTPVSEDNIDDDNYVHHDNDDKTHTRASGTSPPLAWDDTGYGFVDKEGGGVNDGDLQAGPSAAGDSVVKPKSATIAGLDAQIQDLAAQIDSFRRERETLLEFVASQKQRRHRQWDKEEDPGVTLSPGSSAVSRPGDDRSDGRYPAVAVEEMESAVVKHGDDRDGDSPMEVAREDALDMFAHRLSVVEDDCLLLRHELGEYRLVAETRENELLDEIRLLQRRVEELDMRCHAQQVHPHESSTIEVPFSSHDYRPNASRPDYGHEQEDHHQQQPQAGSFSMFDPTPALVPDTTVEDNDPYTIIANITELPTTESHRIPSQVVTVQPSPSHTQFPWLQLNDSELDGLLDAIDGEASMELATPLMPTSFLDRDGEETQAQFGLDREHQSQDQEGDRDRDHSEELMIWNELNERLSDGTGSSTRYRQEGENDGGAASVGGSRSRSGSPSESVVYSDDMRLRERREVQYSPPDDGGKRAWVMGGGGGSACDDLPEALPRAQLEQEVTGEEQWSDANYGAHHDGPHWAHEREDPHSSHPPHQEQGAEVQETGPTRSLTRKTRFEGLGLVFTFPHRPETPSTTDSRSIPRSRSASASPTASTEQLRLELERTERELTVAQELLEQGEDALQDVEGTIRMGSSPSPSSER